MGEAFAWGIVAGSSLIVGGLVALRWRIGRLPLAGYAPFDTASPGTIAFVLAFAAGAMLTMLADTTMPEAIEHGGKLAGVLTTLGFGVAFAIRALE